MIYKNDKLEALLEKQRLKMGAKAFFRESMEPFLEITEVLEQAQIPYALCGLNLPDRAFLPYLTEIVEGSAALDIAHLKGREGIEELTGVFERFPSTHLLRYVPPLPRLIQEDALKEAANRLSLQGQEVYMYYLRYAFVLRLQWNDLGSVDLDGLFNLWQGDVVIFPKRVDWLVAYSLEEEWYAGRLVQPKSMDTTK